MDYLDPQKDFRQHIVLLVGYVLVAVAIVLTALILVNQAYGFGIGKNGTLIQNGLAFFSSHPNPATIYANNTALPQKTNTRLLLPEGIYQIRLTRPGYRDWQRKIEVDGGRVEHFDYPFLIPQTLTSSKFANYGAAPGLMTQSPDRRWLLVGEPGSLTDFDLYDLKDPKKPVSSSLSLPADLLTKSTTGSDNWQLAEWADDNQHVLLSHNYDDKTEFILVDRANVGQSLNLNNTLSISPTKLTLNNKKYDQYYDYTAGDATLQTASLKTNSPTPLLQHVLAYQSYGSDTLLYVTDDGAPSGKVLVKLKVGGTTTTLRSLPAGTNYLVDLTTYSGTMYVAVGATADNRVYIYKDPVGQLAAQPAGPLVPSQVLRVLQPNYLSFSDSAQFIVTENGSSVGVYDIENQQGYEYRLGLPLDAPQTHASWMDGDRLTYVSGGKLVVVDYDNQNRQTLTAAGSAYLPAFAGDYSNLYTLAPSSSAPSQFELARTPLLAPADQ